MKFWKLVSIMWEERDILASCLQHAEWKSFQPAFLNFDMLVKQQERAVLDAIVPEKLIRAVLSKSRQLVFLRDNWLRSRRTDPNDSALGFLSVYDRFGDVLDEVMERGSYRVNEKN
jgi:hypothetical protein